MTGQDAGRRPSRLAALAPQGDGSDSDRAASTLCDARWDKTAKTSESCPGLTRASMMKRCKAKAYASLPMTRRLMDRRVKPGDDDGEPADAGIPSLPRGLKRWVPASAGTSGATNRFTIQTANAAPPLLVTRGAPTSLFPVPRNEGMERREAPGVCETPSGEACEAPPHAEPEQVCETWSGGARRSAPGLRGPRRRRCASRRSTATPLSGAAPTPACRDADQNPSITGAGCADRKPALGIMSTDYFPASRGATWRRLTAPVCAPRRRIARSP